MLDSLRLLFLTGLILAVANSFVLKDGRLRSTCGYAACSEGVEDKINVHIVAHTHDDVGWLKTVDQYYYGAKNDIQQAGVQYILDSVVASLIENSNRKFTYVETAFFWRWWQEQAESTKTAVINLVNNGRLTFTNGAWSMNDEATTHYSSTIENFAWGLRKLNETFGTCGRPTIGWQIDPFGHSRQHATLLSEMAFDGIFLGRIDFQDKAQREANRTMEVIWTTSPNLGQRSQIFAGILPNGYSPPLHFCFDTLCHDSPIMDDPRLNDYNVDEKVKSFVDQMHNQATIYATNHLIVTMGEDFNYQNADMWFKNLDKLIYYVNEQQKNGSDVNLLYSTPACYLNALNKAHVSWPAKSDDFFPYGSGSHTYWTGYFTSRTALKRFERVASGFLQTCKQVDALAGLDPGALEKVAVLRGQLGIAQHHDAVAGTEKQQVAYDYAQRLDVGIKACQEVVADGLAKLANISQASQIKFCDLLNISQCAVTENYKKVALLVWNSIPRQLQQYIHLPVPDGDYMITDSGGQQVSFQITPLFKNVLDIPERTSTATQELVFYATLAPVTFSTYYVYRTVTHNRPSKTRADVEVVDVPDPLDDDIVFQNDYLSVTFDVLTGLVKSLTNLETKDTLNFNQTFAVYNGFAGNNSLEKYRASGAYIFRPNCTGLATQCRTAVAGNGSYEIVQGSEVQEMRQYFAPWISQVTRLHQESRFLEFEWQIGPIPVDDGIGREVISVFSSDFINNGVFYTDSNGREDLQRKRDFRPSYSVNLSEPVAGNYYPVANRIYIRDEKQGTQLTVLTERAQGGSSTVDGQIELMMHRRLLYDDALGVGEALNEPGSDGKGLVVRGKHYLTFTKIATAASIQRLLAQEVYWQPSFAFLPVKKDKEFPVVQKLHRWPYRVTSTCSAWNDGPAATFYYVWSICLKRMKTL
ncbi:lysosomal alpha-mannosidase-like isoform X2 [Paramacrobiotus metropolitanus]|uniref:lysosomal alpha-mannosidase-like isoform X2 n=1 Tax=Paramacrobiotus metropolitanus TaxID=2943436 RepID=UPI002445892A|nr:lysosomal alpha-mannosidase-like isoform X2 [Paramacrobiotus metropolitanus]